MPKVDLAFRVNCHTALSAAVQIGPMLTRWQHRPHAAAGSFFSGGLAPNGPSATLGTGDTFNSRLTSSTDSMTSG